MIYVRFLPQTSTLCGMCDARKFGGMLIAGKSKSIVVCLSCARDIDAGLSKRVTEIDNGTSNASNVD